MLILHPFLSSKAPKLAQLPQILLGPPWDAQVSIRVRKAPGLLGTCRYADLFWSLGPSLSPTNLLLVLLAKEGSESPQSSRAPHGSRTLRSGIQSDLVSQDGQEVPSGPSTPSHTHTHTHTPHTQLQRMEVPEKGWETKVAFTQNQLRGDDRGRVCSPEAGCRPVTLSSKMCEISFCWVFYIKRNLFSEKHSISQTLMAFLCADALMRLRLVLIRRKPCR